MDLIRCLTDLPQLPGSVVTIGSFDGIHRGHLALLGKTTSKAQELGVPAIMLTFYPHPRVIVPVPERPNLRLLTTLEEKAWLVERLTSVDYMLVLDFTRGFAQMSAATFVKEVLVESLKVRHVVVGYDHRFGHDRRGDVAFLQAEGKKYGFGVTALEPVMAEGRPLSSTRIRDLLQQDQLAKANELLGHPYLVQGKVVHGAGRGRLLSYPTANIEIAEPAKVIPARGVYFARAWSRSWAGFGMCNIGVRPTFQQGGDEVIEIHLFEVENGQGSLYGSQLKIELMRKIREEKRFRSAEELKQQLDRDQALCREWIQTEFALKDK